MGPEFEAIAEVVERWEPGVAVVEGDDGTAVAVASAVDGVLVVDVDTVPAPVTCR